MRYARLGIMQGRLSPPIDDQIQAFPAGVWEEEFALSKAIGLGCLEWIYAYPEHASNPLSTARARLRFLTYPIASESALILSSQTTLWKKNFLEFQNQN